MTSRKNTAPPALAAPTALQQAILRLLIIPLLVFIAWLTEMFLLEGSRALFRTPDPLPLLFYTIVGCVLIGTIIPVFLIRRSFASGAVNMNQIGFRSLRRTVIFSLITAAICYFCMVFLIPAGIPRSAVPDLFLLYLPTGIASVMICWVLIGTHLQALVRSGGALISIPVGIVITGIIFGMTVLVQTPSESQPGPVGSAILLGMITAMFFFAVRDVYATVMVVTTGMVILLGGRIDPALLSGPLPGVTISGLLALAVLFLVHAYFSRNYATVLVVADQ
jgi:hypothetical protein